MHLSTNGARVKRTFIPRPSIECYTPFDVSPALGLAPVRAVARRTRAKRLKNYMDWEKVYEP